MFKPMVHEVWAQEAPGIGAGPPQSGAGLLISFVPFIFIFILFYFLLIMPQQKRAKKKREMIANLKKGDRVMTSGGILGAVTTLTPKIVTLQIAEGTRMKVNREYIESVVEDKETGEEDK